VKTLIPGNSPLSSGDMTREDLRAYIDEVLEAVGLQLRNRRPKKGKFIITIPGPVIPSDSSGHVYWPGCSFTIDELKQMFSEFSDDDSDDESVYVDDGRVDQVLVNGQMADDKECRSILAKLEYDITESLKRLGLLEGFSLIVDFNKEPSIEICMGLITRCGLCLDAGLL
jgi:hypothetical protein